MNNNFKKRLSDDEIKEILMAIKTDREDHNVKNWWNMKKVIEKYFPNFMEENLFIEDILYIILEDKVN
ncbi:MAG: hypothetical protein ACLRU4_03555 [Peptoniphilus sp.]|uniref:hypothetical protein n=1 Tax=Peptoniphilus sp. TaxID=1971214 RepID=UPI0039A1B7D6